MRAIAGRVFQKPVRPVVIPLFACLENGVSGNRLSVCRDETVQLFLPVFDHDNSGRLDVSLDVHWDGEKKSSPVATHRSEPRVY